MNEEEHSTTLTAFQNLKRAGDELFLLICEELGIVKLVKLLDAYLKKKR